MRLTKIYTRTGDEGFTNLGKRKVSKDEALIEALGTVDELNSFIGLIFSQPIQDQTIVTALTQIQHDLFDLGGELYLPERVAITAEKITRLEEWLDGWNQTLPPLEEFLLPRGHCQVARSVCRRAERCLVTLHRQTPLSNLEMLKYLNRLSDLLFVLARVLGREQKERETMWVTEK